MNAQEYCLQVDKNEREQKALIETTPIKEDNSPLISLKNSGFNLILEPSIKKNYNYFVREAVVEKIGRISNKLDKENKVLIIRSAWRSFRHQRLLWVRHFEIICKKHPEKHLKEIRDITSNFIAAKKQSMHSTGGAVDALIYDLKNDCIMDFGTNDGYTITLTEKCYPHYPDISEHAKQNRKLLINLFEEEDFVCDLKEYWHFDYGNALWAIEKGRDHAIYGKRGRAPGQA
jgi:zinc D-Ala-D-Ala dipeptidase